MKKSVFLMIVSVLALCFFVALAPEPRTDEESITLNGNTIVFDRTQAAPANAISGKHRILVFNNDVLSTVEREQLSNSGIKLLSYLGDGAYLSSVTEDASFADSGVFPAAGISIEPDVKIAGVLREENLIERWKSSDKKVLAFVATYEDEDKDKLARLLRRSGVEVEDTDLTFPNGFMVRANWPSIEQLLSEDVVRVVEPPMSEGELDHLAWLAYRSSVDQVRENPKRFGNVTGKKIMLGLWDSVPYFHGDFQGRVSWAPDDFQKIRDWHGTHTAGIILARGGQEEGMAPQARLVHYTYQGDVVSEVRQAAEKYGIRITSNSWSARAGWQAAGFYPIEDQKVGRMWRGEQLYGFYNTAAEEYDRAVREVDVVGVFSAGNNRSNGFMGRHVHLDVDGQQTDELFYDYHASEVRYGAITGFNLAKNVITVGATFNDDNLCDFSSTGPTDDGRLKPDVVANGYSVRSTSFDLNPSDLVHVFDSYRYMSGTSMSTPAVSGILALLMESYDKQFKDRMSSVVAKAVLLHGTRDLGLPGPDYFYGHGIADAAYSLKTITDARNAMKNTSKKAPSAFIVEDELEHRKNLSYTLNVPDETQELRVTLVWHDVPGPKIINNLDVWAVSPSGKKLLPFALNPRDPEAAAKRKRNKLDNSESIRLAEPEAGEWTINVRGRKVPFGPQPFALVASSGRGDRVFDNERVGKFDHIDAFVTLEDSSAASAEPAEVLSRGDRFSIFFELQVADTTVFDTDNGSVNIEYIIRGPGGKIYMRYGGRSTQYKVGETRKGLIPIFTVPEDMPLGDYQLEAVYRMFNGEIISKSYDFKIK